MKTALYLVALALASGLAAAQAKPDTRSDYLRSESAKRGSTEAGRVGPTLDLNTAQERDLAALPGIGPEKAKAIVRGRPYRTRDDLLKRNILDQSSYSKVKDILTVRGSSTTVPRGGREAPGG